MTPDEQLPELERGAQEVLLAADLIRKLRRGVGDAALDETTWRRDA